MTLPSRQCFPVSEGGLADSLPGPMVRREDGREPPLEPTPPVLSGLFLFLSLGLRIRPSSGQMRRPRDGLAPLGRW